MLAFHSSSKSAGLSVRVRQETSGISVERHMKSPPYDVLVEQECVSAEDQARLDAGAYQVEAELSELGATTRVSAVFQKPPPWSSAPLELTGLVGDDIVHQNGSLGLVEHGPPREGETQWYWVPLWHPPGSDAESGHIIFDDQDAQHSYRFVWSTGNGVSFGGPTVDMRSPVELLGPSFARAVLDPYQAGSVYRVVDAFGWSESAAPALFLVRQEGDAVCEAWRTPLPGVPLVGKAFEFDGTRHVGLVIRARERFSVLHVAALADERPSLVEEVDVPIASLPAVASAGALVEEGRFRFSFVATMPDGRQALVMSSFGRDGNRAEVIGLPGVSSLRVGRATFAARWPEAKAFTPTPGKPTSHDPRWVIWDDRGRLTQGGLDAKTNRPRVDETCSVATQVPGSPYLSDTGLVAQQSFVGGPIFEGCRLLVRPEEVAPPLY
jgi:hypothetical protein